MLAPPSLNIKNNEFSESGPLIGRFWKFLLNIFHQQHFHTLEGNDKPFNLHLIYRKSSEFCHRDTEEEFPTLLYKFMHPFPLIQACIKTIVTQRTFCIL